MSHHHGRIRYAAISQMKPAISRAIAVTTTFLFFPLALIERYFLHSLICPFQAMSSTSLLNPSCREAIFLPTHQAEAGTSAGTVRHYR